MFILEQIQVELQALPRNFEELRAIPIRSTILEALKFYGMFSMLTRSFSGFLKSTKPTFDSRTRIKIWDAESHWPCPIEPPVSTPIVINELCNAFSISSSHRLEEIEISWNQKTDREKWDKFISVRRHCHDRFGYFGNGTEKHRFTPSFFNILIDYQENLRKEIHFSNHGTCELESAEMPHIFEEFEWIKNDENEQCFVNELGDLNGDGIEDFVFGFPGTPSVAGTGEVRFGVYNREDQVVPSVHGFMITGFSKGYDENGLSISKLGDTNGDGIDDFAFKSLPGTPSVAGSVYIIYGKHHWENQVVPGTDIMITGFSKKNVGYDDANLDEESTTDSAIEPFTKSLAKSPLKRSMTV